MLIELKDVHDELFMINPDHIVEFSRIKNTDTYSLKSLVGERIISSAMAIYLHSAPTLSLSMIKMDEEYLARCVLQVTTSTMFPALEPKIIVEQPDKNTFYKNDTYQVVARVQDSDATITWSSSNNNVATVSTSGLVTFKGLGVVTIMATADGITPGAAVLNCISVDITVTPTTKTVYVDSPDFQLNSNSLLQETHTWDSTNKSIATVDTAGKVKILSSGKTNISASLRGESAICEVTVLAPSITVDKNTVSLQRQQTSTVVATVTNLENKEVSWTSDNESVATVSNGVITAVGSGSASIKASTSHGYATVSVTVEEIVLTGDATRTMTEGDSGTWTVNVAGTNLKANYISSDVSVATINPTTGAVSAIGAGSTTLTASVLDVSKTCALTVEAPPVIDPPPTE